MRMPQGKTNDGSTQSVLSLLGAVFLIVCFHLVGRQFLDGYVLDLGNIAFPSARYSFFLLLYSMFGTCAAALLTIGLARMWGVGKAEDHWLRAWRSGPDAWWIGVGMLAGFLIPAVIRWLVLDGARITDDESAYRFAAECLASGRLYVESPPMKLFFDNAWMINDGKFYSHYFLGWPLLLVPGVWLGISGYMNAVYSALTVPAVFLSLRRAFGSSWAKLGVIIFLASPMGMVAAATEMSHTTCVMCLIWLTWLVLRSQDADAPLWTHVAVALTFSAAFFNRPLAALGIGAPLLICWLIGVLRHESPGRWRAVGVFTVTALTMGLLFVLVNYAQNGSLFKVAYVRYLEYSAQNDFRFSSWHGGADEKLFSPDDLGRATATTGVGILRINYALFGWPLTGLLILLSPRSPLRGLAWFMIFSFLLLHFFYRDVGIDSYGPVHYSELSWPMLVLLVGAFRGLSAWGAGGRLPVPGGRSLGGWLAAAMILVALVCYVPVRFTALRRIAANVNLPTKALEDSGLTDAVIFYYKGWTKRELIAPTNHFVFWRPNNDPDLKNDVLWANHLTVDYDKQLMGLFPNKTGYVMGWDEQGRPRFVRLDSLAPGSIPNGVMGGSSQMPHDEEQSP